MEKRSHIISTLAKSSGAEESSEIYTITTVHSGLTEVVVKYELSKRLPIQELAEAQRLYESINGGGGRKVPTLYQIEDFMRGMSPKI